MECLRRGTLLGILALAASPASAFEDSFETSGALEEAPNATASSSAAWWLDAGGRVTFRDGSAFTMQGEAPPGDRWRLAYGQSNPRDTDGGAHPQNLLRLLTQQTGATFRQRVSVRIHATHLSASPQRDRFSGVFLWSRYQDPGDDLYVAGMRFDGQAVIKKKQFGVYHTLAVRGVYPGAYDRAANPTLLPQNHWFSMRLSTEDVSEGVRLRLEIHDPWLGPEWIPLLEAIDRPGGADGPPLTSPGRAGMRGDFMDLELDEYLAFVPTGRVSEWPGLHDDASARFAIETVPTPETPVREWTFGTARGGALPIAGRFAAAGSCGDTAGLYRPDTGTFQIRFANAPGVADAVFSFGGPDRGFRPVAGDWDGDGIDGVGLYDEGSSVFFLRDPLAGGAADQVVAFGPPGRGLRPIAGDWNGDGTDTVGVYDPASGAFYLRNRHAPGAADEAFVFGPGGAGIEPVAGDWNGDGIDTVGLFRPADGLFALRGAHAGGAADRVGTIPASSPEATPIAGRWESACPQ